MIKCIKWLNLILKINVILKINLMEIVQSVRFLMTKQ